ncbi:DUF6801 domain-containing protein [Streptomyces sp. NPDC050529]|uniref:DUF6801 domain-containing protein n=1 Tax=Streptomyces sp. NPDC050529 TaxID=3365624 RepID=UPI00379F02F1
MKRSGKSGAPRRTARGAAVAAAVLLGGMIPGAQAAAGAQEIDANLAYTCDFPAGKYPVKVGITAKVAESVQAGRAIQPEDVAVEVVLPEGALTGPADSGPADSGPADSGSAASGSAASGPAASGAATVSAEMLLSTDVSQGDKHAKAEWAGATAEATPIPDKGDLTLRTSGAVPYVRPGASGDLSLKAARLSGVLTTRTAAGAPTEPRTIPLSCELDADQDSTLATVKVVGEGGPSTPTPSASDDWPEDGAGLRDPGVPEVGKKAAEEPAAADAPKCVGDATNDVEMVAYVTGYANVTKLKGANKFPLACSRIYTYPSVPPVIKPPYIHVYMTAAMVLDYQGKPQLPPTTGTFLTFGFMPTTATLEMTQIPPRTDTPDAPNVHVHTVTDLTTFTTKAVTTIDVKLVLRLRDVKVNGVPLDVGNNCRTERPFTLPLEGVGNVVGGVLDGYQLTAGGPLTGSVTIPPFQGCGVGEDLDSLFTASLSGVPGFVKQMQGAPCIASVSNGCTSDNQPSDIPKAER